MHKKNVEEGKEQTTDSAFGCEFVDVGERELCYMKEKRGDESRKGGHLADKQKLVQGTISRK